MKATINRYEDLAQHLAYAAQLGAEAMQNGAENVERFRHVSARLKSEATIIQNEAADRAKGLIEIAVMLDTIIYDYTQDASPPEAQPEELPSLPTRGPWPSSTVKQEAL